MDIKEVCRNKYELAFVQVAKILEPNVNFTSIHVKEIHDGCSVETIITLGGNDSHGNNVVVTTEPNPNEGLQIVVKRFDAYTNVMIYKHSVWYFSFNWKGLINTQTIKKR